MSRAGPRAPVPEARLSRDLSHVYRYGYRGALILVVVGVLLPYFTPGRLGTVAVAGVLVLLATPVAAAVWVGVVAMRYRDWRLVFIVAGVLLIPAASFLILFSG